jgi:hypothetical protein
MSTATDRVAQLQHEQAAAWAEAEAAELAERSRFPDAQWDGPALMMPAAPYDPTPAEQQQFADTYRAEHSDADRLDHHGGTPLSAALYEWRDTVASERWTAAADAFVAAPPCELCGADSQHDHLTVGDRTVFVCRRCRPSMLAAFAEAVANETLADGRTRGKAARALVVAALAKKGP